MMNNSIDLYKSQLKQFSERKNTIIHEARHDKQPLYIIHQYDKDQENSDKIKNGKVYILYQKPLSLPHDSSRAVIEYRLVNRINEEAFVELITLKLDESYREMGLGTLLLKYFETKIVLEYFSNTNHVKGILIIGDQNLKKFFKKHGYRVVDNAFSKEIKPQTKEKKKSNPRQSFFK